MKLVLAIRSLDIGGAERQFIELVKNIDKNKFDVTVCTMYGGVQESVIKDMLHVEYIHLHKKGRYDFYSFFTLYKKVLRDVEPDVIYSFLGEMNLFSLWAKPKKTKVIWGFRASNMDLKRYGKVPQMMFWLQKRLSSRVDAIIANSQASITFHQEHHFCMDRSVVIRNGIDTKRFQRDDKKRELFRGKYDLKKDDIGIGIVARIDYIKGYLVFSKATKKILDRYESVKIFAVGDGDKEIKKECQDILGDYDDTRFVWLGTQNSVEDIYSGLDITSSSSFSEGFSNSIAEAMSCECAVVVSDVGDSALMVECVGVVVKPRDEDSLYDGLVKMIESDYVVCGNKSRVKVVENYSIKKMVDSTQRELIKCAVS